MHVCYACLHVIYVYVCMRACMYVCNVRMYFVLCVYVGLCMNILLRTHVVLCYVMRVCMYVCTYVCMYVMYVCTLC